MAYLLAHGANVNAQSKQGISALQTAHLYGHSKCVDLLIEHGADESSLQGLEFGFRRQVIETNSSKFFKDSRQKARYCE